LLCILNVSTSSWRYVGADARCNYYFLDINLFPLSKKKWRVEDIPHTMELIASPATSPKRLPKGLLDASDKKPRPSAHRKWVFVLAWPNKLFDAPRSSLVHRGHDRRTRQE
jgi:hypothetical protein